MITIYLPVFRWDYTSKLAGWVLSQRSITYFFDKGRCYTSIKDWVFVTDIYGWETKFLAILDYLKRGLR